jgi:hypothetical protein
MATKLTDECKAGAAARTAMNVDVPYLFSSDSWLAYRAGQQIRGMSGIRRCTKSRGYSVRIETTGGSLIIATFEGRDLGIITIERS